MLKFNDQKWRCKCGRVFGEDISNSKITIYGNNAQEIKVEYKNIEIICSKCGKKHRKKEGASPGAFGYVDDYDWMPRNTINENIYGPLYSLMSGSYFELPAYYRNKLLKKLTAKQKEIYKVLTETAVKDDDYVSISHRVGLPINVVKEHVAEISKLVEQLKKEDQTKNVDTNFFDLLE